MAKNKSDNEQNILLNQEENNITNNIKKKNKWRFWEHSLLLKQTLITAWKTKLQLVILLLLTAFATSLVTGSWISYQRIVEGQNTLQLSDANFDAVLPTTYSKASQPVSQIANQAFSLKLGRLYYQEVDSEDSVAVYFDNTIIGQELQPLSNRDLKITYIRDSNNHITGIETFQWDNLSQPLEFNLNNANVKGSMYGQLMLKASQTNNKELKNNYLRAASDLYNSLFVNYSAGQILASVRLYFEQWITKYSTDTILDQSDDEFTTFLLMNKINYRGSADPNRDLRIPNEVNLATDTTNVLRDKIVQETDDNPRLTERGSEDFGMNGQWMIIYRNFAMNPQPNSDVIKDFANQYKSPSNYNLLNDGNDPSVYSVFFARGAAALQNREINVVNQFVTTSGVEANTGKSLSVKVVNLGLKKIHNDVNLKIFEGIYPSSSNEIAISPQYARTYGIKPGDTINISNRPFIVSGIGGDAYNIYPLINSLDPIPNTRNEFIAYVRPDSFYDSTWIEAKDKTDVSLMYFLPWKNVPVPGFDTNYFNDYYQRTIFSDNKLNDRSQYDYDQYLIEKYIRNNPDYQSKYQLNANLVVVQGDSQFDVYARGRTMLSSVLLGFKYLVYIGVVFLVLIVIFITYLIIKKAIQKGQVSMGILKSSGYSTWSIIVSYLAYPLVVLFIAIPIGWFVGLAIQIYFTEIFNTLFILPYNVLNFNIVPLFISIALICGFVLITTLITGYKMLQKEPLILMKKDSDIEVSNKNKIGWLQEKFKDKFKSRFILSLSRTSWKKITITSVVIAVATLAITATVSVPATINSMSANYFKTQKYKNYYQYQTPVSNMPLSKYGLYAWNNFNKPTDEPYYPVSGGMPWPEDVIINGSDGTNLAWYNPLEYQKTGNSNNFAEIVKFFTSDTAERTKIINQVGEAISKTGALDMNFLSWSYSWMGGRVFSNALIKDLAELDLSDDKSFSNSLITFATLVLPGILGVSNPGVPPSPDAIVEILKQTLPGFMRQVLDSKGPNAYDYFAIGHNSIAYNPNYSTEVAGPEEELVTQFQLASADSNLVNRGLLDIEGINPETKMLVMKSGLAQNLKYASTANTIPMVINRSFAARFNLGVGDQFNGHPKVKTLYYKNNQGKLRPIPKNNWYYGANPVGASDDGAKSIWNKSANKWNARGRKNIEDTDYSDTYGYQYNGVYNNKGERELDDDPTDWNNTNNVWLKLPADITGAVKSGTLRSSDTSKNLPFKVSNIGVQDGDTWWVQPFSYHVADEYFNEDIDPTSLLLTRIPEWYGAMLDQENLVVDYNLHDNFASEIETNMPEWWSSIVGSNPVTNYRVIGIQDSYDTPKAYIDQKWANLIAGYSYYDVRTEAKDPMYAPGIYQWFSGKLSASDDIYDIVGRMAFKRNADDYSIYSMSGLRGNVEEPIVANSDLLLRKKEMLNKMAEIALSASLLFIVTTVICAILIVIMITDSFTDQFRIFMARMKAEGYTNKEINSFTLGIFTPWAFVGYVVGYGLGFLSVFGFIQIITRFAGLAFPFSFIWWIIPLSFGIIALIYFSTYIINNHQLNKMNLIGLLKSDE
ncbi:ABC transporter permease [Spiroplasma platyhelix]|uniref:ABC transporter permease n=1 Tax=Spiroplasma platyhelix PALS-1 TaxID=1276218 RepID=A0A846U0T7_9MOLU|nr:ABC transporter permease [Spiroplasma platyhelix]MBE4704066.1 hypothetical protein [Spiroplasma platyhelix PALS-1]NKE38436.1 ABC transporter permease [Spiroplasma platyhelix PALS-1]UJB29324.1 hypothetical protein SPLAT_v1c05600 [Spiroplasma platyhelix PALS-1]